MTKKIVSLAIFVVVFIASLSGGIYANVQASAQNTLYKEQAHYAEKYENLYNKAVEADNPIIGSLYFKNLYQEKTENAKMQAHLYKKEMQKYFGFAAVLIFVALAMLVCSVVTALPIIKMKKAGDTPEDENAEEPKKVLKAKPEPEKKERPKSDFDIILEAPKPHINSEDE